MIAVYYASSIPFSMFTINVEDDDIGKFLDVLAKSEFPFPESDVIFIENDKVVNQWDPFTGEHNESLFL